MSHPRYLILSLIVYRIASMLIDGWLSVVLLFCSALIGNYIRPPNLYQFPLSECSAIRASLHHQRRLMEQSFGALEMIQDKMITLKKQGQTPIGLSPEHLKVHLSL